MTCVKKVFKRVLSIITALSFVMAVIILVLTIVSVTALDKESTGGLFGHKVFIVMSDSMKPIFSAGDIVVTKTANFKDLKVGDTIAFSSIDPDSYGELIIHIINGTANYDGEPVFVTKGVNVRFEDAYPVTENKIFGKYQIFIPKMGYVLQFLKTSTGYFSLIFTPLCLLILIESINFIRELKQYKKAKQEETDRQKDELEAEKQKAKQLEEELAKLKSKQKDSQVIL